LSLQGRVYYLSSPPIECLWMKDCRRRYNEHEKEYQPKHSENEISLVISSGETGNDPEDNLNDQDDEHEEAQRSLNCVDCGPHQQ